MKSCYAFKILYFILCDVRLKTYIIMFQNYLLSVCLSFKGAKLLYNSPCLCCLSALKGNVNYSTDHLLYVRLSCLMWLGILLKYYGFQLLRLLLLSINSLFSSICLADLIFAAYGCCRPCSVFICPNFLLLLPVIHILLLIWRRKGCRIK